MKAPYHGMRRGLGERDMGSGTAIGLPAVWRIHCKYSSITLLLWVFGVLELLLRRQRHSFQDCALPSLPRRLALESSESLPGVLLLWTAAGAHANANAILKRLG